MDCGQIRIIGLILLQIVSGRRPSPVNCLLAQSTSNRIFVDVIDCRNNGLRLCQISIVAGAFLPESKSHHTRTWPNGEVFRYDGNRSWTSVGRLGTEKEVMGMAVYNGKLYAGTLPLAEVYRYDGDNRWLRTGQLDKTPAVRYRRAWSMAVYNGKLYCGTLPSGHVFSIEAGKSVTYDHALPAGWVHLVAVKGADKLRLYINGKQVATSTPFNKNDYDISNSKPLKIGFGTHDYFNGKLRDVRIYRRTLTGKEIADLANGSK